MKIGNLQVSTQNTEVANKNVQGNNLQVGTSKGNGELPQTMASLTPGEVFEGTVTRDESGRLTIHLSNGESVSARMEGSVNLLENTATFFEVKSNQGGQLAIRTVSQAASANPTLIKALEQAGVAVDSDNLVLVQEMMKQQLPIDAKSLSNMVRIAYANKGIDPMTLIQLTKLGLPVTQENVQQFQQYMAGEGSIVKSLDNIMGKLPTALENWGNSGLDGKTIVSRLCDIFNSATGEVTNSHQNGNAPIDFNITGEAGGEATLTVEAILNGEQAVPEGTIKNAAQQSVEAQPLQGQSQAGEVLGDVQKTAVQQNEVQQFGYQQNVTRQTGNQVSGEVSQSTSQMIMDLVSSEGEMLNTRNQVVQGGSEGIANEANAQKRATMTPIEQLIEDLGVQLKKGEIAPKELLNLLNKQLASLNLTKEDFQMLFQDKTFKNLLTGLMEKEWLLTPEEFKGDNKINEVYEKVQHQLNRLEQLLGQMGKTEQPVIQDVKDVRANVQFMNDLSQFYNYVQIPLKMFSQNARGDLYVYTDKRALQKGKEELTAHLHLELEHLGITDVYVRLKEKKLSTNFIMEKEESLDLVMENIDILTQRLQEKGYEVSTKVEMRTEENREPDFMQEVLGKELPSIAIQRYSLDVCV